MAKSLLIVEDEALIAFDLKLTLERYGYKVLGTADTSRGAVSMAKDLKPDALLMDIVLKGSETGIDAARQIRSFSEAPILFISGNASTVEGELFGSIPNSGSISKPIHEQRLVDTIGSMIGGR